MKRRIQNSGFRIQKGTARILSFFILAVSALAAPEGVARFERSFADAVRAYDENRLPEAIAGWQALVDEGQAHGESSGRQLVWRRDRHPD